MKISKPIFAVLLGLSVMAVAADANAQSKSNKQGFATAVRVQGIVTYSLGKDQPEYPLVPGKYLPPGAIVFTKDNGVVDLILGKAIDLPQAKWSPEHISLAHDSEVRGYVTYKPSADQNAIRLTPHSTLAIDRLTIVDTGSDTVSDTELDLQKGKIFASVRKLNGASQYLVKIPNGVAGIRGTLFTLDASGSMAVYESKNGGAILAVTLPDGSSRTFQINAGQFLDISSGSLAPIPPDLGQVLNEVFDALRTTYFQECDFEYDRTNDHVSKTTGKGKGKGNGNGNENNQ